ncbi:MAG: DNA-binding response regulator [Chloroflexi bacterium]|nr:MAG: DNA-binding response regulator [Chloroflexota bacterium]
MSSQRIVVVDDDPVTAKVMRLVFEDEGYETVTLTRGSQAYAEIIGRDTQLVILDVNLPDINGFSLCKELRARRYYGPVIFLTGRADLEDKLEGFRIGADDYIVKPFEPLELVARVESVVRRFHHHDQQSLGTVLRVDDAELSIGELTYSSDVVEPVVLSPTEMRILECLMRNARIVISRERLIERVWGYDLEGDTNRVDVYIRRVRRKIEEDAAQPRYLHTVRGLGYVFRPENETAGTDDATAAA